MIYHDRLTKVAGLGAFKYFEEIAQKILTKIDTLGGEIIYFLSPKGIFYFL
jgi:hypothetical protein